MLETPLSAVDDTQRRAGTIADSAGGKFVFEDGGAYCGGWLNEKAHGYGVCTGPGDRGEFAGKWTYGYETSGTYRWPNGACRRLLDLLIS